MSRSELATAAELLSDAGDASDDDEAADRLADLAEQLDRFADSDRGPDHGRLARIQTALDEIQSAVTDDVAATVEDALDHIREYRSTVEGV